MVVLSIAAYPANEAALAAGVPCYSGALNLAAMRERRSQRAHGGDRHGGERLRQVDSGSIAGQGAWLRLSRGRRVPPSRFGPEDEGRHSVERRGSLALARPTWPGCRGGGGKGGRGGGRLFGLAPCL